MASIEVEPQEEHTNNFTVGVFRLKCKGSRGFAVVHCENIQQLNTWESFQSYFENDSSKIKWTPNKNKGFYIARAIHKKTPAQHGVIEIKDFAQNDIYGDGWKNNDKTNTKFDDGQ
jgi:hypothetical protein